jgi:hypothetical protein
LTGWLSDRLGVGGRHRAGALASAIIDGVGYLGAVLAGYTIARIWMGARLRAALPSSVSPARSRLARCSSRALVHSRHPKSSDISFGNHPVVRESRRARDVETASKNGESKGEWA